MTTKPRIPEEHMAVIHAIRQDFAQALAEAQADPDDMVASAHMEEQHQRRERAIRMIRDEDNMSIRDLAAIFRCSKAAVRTALTEEESDG